MFAQSAMTIAAFGIAVAISTGTIQYWMLVAAGGVQGLGMSVVGAIATGDDRRPRRT